MNQMPENHCLWACLSWVFLDNRATNKQEKEKQQMLQAGMTMHKSLVPSANKGTMLITVCCRSNIQGHKTWQRW